MPLIPGGPGGYGVVCIGTTTVHAMLNERELLANRLVHLRGQFEDD